MSILTQADSNAIIEQQLDEKITLLEDVLDADVLTFSGAIVYGTDTLIRDHIEKIDPKRETLAMMLETSGGYIEVVQRIVDTLRHHYPRVVFIIPNYAMSAGTVLVMSGDAIYMDYFSVLGPIDPQVHRRSGSGDLVPALGYLVQYERLMEKSRSGSLTTAELVFLVEKFDPAELFHFEQARELSITLLKNWLANYKFKNWKTTETRKKKVTPAMRTRRAAEVAKLLNKTEHWHSHSRGLSIAVLRSELKLRIEDYSDSEELRARIRDYYNLLVDFMVQRRHEGVLHVKGCYTPYIGGT